MAIRTSKYGWALAAASAAALAAASAHAQDGAASKPNQVEEVIVTATKRDTGLQQTPVSVSAFGQDYIHRNNIREFADFASSIPNVSAPKGLSGTGNVSIRGISSPVRSGSGVEQPVGVYFDGVSVDNASLNGLILDIASIEVLRGPQGAIWGRNTPAGAILYTTERPTRTFQGFVDAQAGDFSLRQLTGAVSGPIAGDKVLLRVAAGHLERDGFTQRISGGTLGDVDQDVVRGSLRLLPTDNLDITLIAQHDDWRSHMGGQEYFTGPFAQISGTNGYARRVDTDFYQPSQRKTNAFTGIVEQHMGGYVLTSLTGYRTFKSSELGDTDATNQFLVHEYTLEHNDQFSQEFRLASPKDGRFRWLAGLYFFDEKQNLGDIALLGPAALGLPPGSEIIQDIGGELETKSYAAFGQASFDLTRRLTLRAGLRASRDDKTADITQKVRQFIVLPPPSPALDDTAATPFTGKYRNSKVTPVVGFDYKPSEDLMVFANVGKGYKSGGFNPSDPAKPTYGPENSTSYEAGVKSEWLDRRLVLNATAFYVTYDDLQAQAFDNLAIIFVNAGEAESRGLEFEMTAKPAEGWDLHAAVGLNDAKFKTFVLQGMGPGGADLDLSGNRLPFAPRVNGSVSSRYTFPLGSLGDAYVQGEWSYSGSYFLDITNDPQGGKQSPFQLVNARFGLLMRNGTVELALWGRNLGNQDYKVDFVGNLPDAIFHGSKFQMLAAPRTWGVDLHYRF
jgi:iron complex outermembrane receptor protein